MGRLTLANFRSELELIGGNRSLGNTRIDLWVNTAVDEISGAVRFKALQNLDTKDTVADTRTVALSAGVIGVSALWDITNDNRLIYAHEENFVRYDQDVTGNPKLYTVIAGNIYLWPVPDDVYTLNMITRIEATALTDVAHTTPFSNQWDWGVMCMAAHYMFLSLEEMEQATLWFNRAISQINSRTTDDELIDDSNSLPLEIAKDFEDLSRMRFSDYLR